MLIYNINEGDGGMHQRHKKILDMLQAGKLLIKEAAVEPWSHRDDSAAGFERA